MEVGAILASSMECDGPKFDCGIAEVRAARSVLITLYSVALLCAAVVAFSLRRRALLQWAVFSVCAVCVVRIALFALPFYYTVSLMRNGLGGVVLFLDVLPEGLFYLAVLLFYLSFIAFLRALQILHTASGASGLPANRVLSRARLWMAAAGLSLLLLTFSAGIATQLALRSSTWSHWFYLKLDPMLDSVFICVGAAGLEAFLFAMALLRPYRLKTTLLLALLPAAKGLYGAIEWIIWVLPNGAWAALWVIYFIVTELVPLGVVLAILYTRVRNQRSKRTSPVADVTERHPLLYTQRFQ